MGEVNGEMTRTRPGAERTAEIDPGGPSAGRDSSTGRGSTGRRLDIDGARISYAREGNQLLAVDGVSLTIQAGEFVAIVGPSGCGKTTLLLAIDGLVPLASGAISLDSRAVTKPGKDRAVVFQDPSLLPWRSVLGNVMFAMQTGRQRAGRQRQAAFRERALRLLDLVGLAEFATAYPTHLSGGMQQRVNLARALAGRPELLLLDEPFAALDSQTRENMQEELLRILDVEQTTAVLITHQIDEAVYLSDRVVVFSARPATVITEFTVPEPRPRRTEFRDSDHFNKLVHDIRSLVRREYERGGAKTS
jgi:NitT/TauT family transport system ATP-binding protein